MAKNVNANSPSGGVYEQRFKDWFETPADPKILYRNAAHGMLVRLDDRPVTSGHMLAVPWESAQYAEDLADPRYDKLQRVARAAGRHIGEVLRRDQDAFRYVGTLVAGGQVWHSHIHRAPCYAGPDWVQGFAGAPRLELTDDQWDATVEKFGFDAEVKAALDAELDRIAPAEDLEAMERYAVDLRDRRLEQQLA